MQLIAKREQNKIQNYKRILVFAQSEKQQYDGQE
jgi:hypothetical protein